jgi:hypothetical protein
MASELEELVANSLAQRIVDAVEYEIQEIQEDLGVRLEAELKVKYDAHDVRVLINGMLTSNDPFCERGLYLHIYKPDADSDYKDSEDATWS